jgi:hypothetical protein
MLEPAPVRCWPASCTEGAAELPKTWVTTIPTSESTHSNYQLLVVACLQQCQDHRSHTLCESQPLCLQDQHSWENYKASCVTSWVSETFWYFLLSFMCTENKVINKPYCAPRSSCTRWGGEFFSSQVGSEQRQLGL